MKLEQEEEILLKELPLSEEEIHRLSKIKKKAEQSFFEVAFCGHFSAGKSTILNRLLGAEVLPTSPIPTSANIISIMNGPLALHVKNRHGEETKWEGEIPWQRVREWGMNGHDISELTICAPLDFLGNHSKILDTPGVDSTDESHEAVTVEQLYTTDVIVYVMDYNHVQSETNLYFLKQLSKEKKPLYIVINQIDKHNEEELSIQTFTQSIEDVFQSWEISYLGMYFTTMKHPDHPLNEFTQFSRQMKALLYNSESLMPVAKERLVEGTMKAIEHRLFEEKKEKVDEVKELLQEKGYDEQQLVERNETVQLAYNMSNANQFVDQAFSKEMESLFANVTLFPFTTTDLTRNWLESMQSSFKVGLFFTKKKTEEEQEKRLQAVLEELQDKVKTQLIFHVQKYFQQLDKVKLTNKELVEQAITKLNVEVNAKLFHDNVKTEHTSRDYVFTFTKQITNEIVKAVRKQAMDVLELYKQGMQSYWNKEKERLHLKLKQYEVIDTYIEQMNVIEKEYDRLIEQTTKIELKQSHELELQMKDAMKEPFPDTDKDQHDTFNVSLPSESVIETIWNEVEKTEQVEQAFDDETTRNWLDKVKESLLPFEDNVLLQQERQQLLERIERYEKQTFVISLFGAFSAGKSSFANALLGESILPVSPHPTTATVNTVQQSTSEHAHETAQVYVKSFAQLDEEIKAVGEQLDENVTLDSIDKWKPKRHVYESSWQKTYAEYLRTIQSTLRETTWQLGSTFEVSLSQLQPLIAEEKNACLLEKVDIFYDCDITKKGITLVDTPGVNSIHGRHTNVAFHQLRRSDAIFYVTYYNHAFSKADQYFLQQMGKVNESFTHDKLYFVINAADLAGSEYELNGVRKHVYEQLQRNGIDKPRLYHLSAKKGLEAKRQATTEDKWFQTFEQSFYKQTIAELKELSFAIIQEQTKQYTEIIKNSLAFMNEEKEKQQEEHKQLLTAIAQAKSRIEAASFSHVIFDIQQELDQLSVYLKDRMLYVLNDFYTHAINAATITGSSKKELQKSLTTAIREWKGHGEYVLKQELEANLIRLEQKVKNRAQQWVGEQEIELHQSFPYLTCSDEVLVDPFTLTHPLVLQIEIDHFTTIKSKKDFFENKGISHLKESLVQEGGRLASIVITETQQELHHQVEEKSAAIEKMVKERLQLAVQQEKLRFEQMLDKSGQQILMEEQQALAVLV
ncbi:dynamin family protein [Alkalihalobacillus sp. LMS39]|uniref:dynamin family protein n=1 Tax=Alkalihalobacillus sp. LMS39 TaxID=2924032 RepID=UPI001FB40C60|nr:dynamin family protein [Alkalihalobacillus sp. LMS39]UOE92299.1 dynamin family protein [Alkalihalobacillus sp. LMS39]